MAGLAPMCLICLLLLLTFQVQANHQNNKLMTQLKNVLEDLANKQDGSMFVSRNERTLDFSINARSEIKMDDTIQRGVGASVISLLKTILPKIPQFVYKTGLVLVNLGDTGLKIGSIVKSLGDSYTNGCFSVPMICTYMDRIKQIEPRCIEKAAKLEKEYGKYKADYGLLQDVAENNVYINTKIEEFVDMLGVLDQEGQNVKKIQDASLNLKQLRGKTDADLLKLLYIPIEYSVVKLKELKDSSSIFTADLFSILTFEIGSYISKAAFAKYEKHMENLNCAGCQLFQNSRTGEQYRQMVYKAMKLTYSDFKNFFKDGYFIKNIKDLTSSAWNSFKLKITNPKSTVQKYIKGLSAASALASLAANAINIHLLIQQHKAWKEIEAKMEEAWKMYVDREKELDAAIESAKEKSEPLPTYTQNLIDNYVTFVITFDEKVGKLLQDSGLPKQIISSKERITSANVKAKQTETLRNLDKIINNLQKMRNWMKAFSTFNSHVKNKLDANVPLNAAFKEIKDNWRYFAKDVQEYFFLVRLENYVCTVSTLRLTDDFYTNYDLKSVRGTCGISPRFTFSEEYKKNHVEHTLNFYVKLHLNSAVSLNQLHNNVAKELKDDPIISSDAVLTEQMLLCKVAELFPLQSKWSRYQLQHFRVKSCKTMPHGDFLKLLEKAYS